MKKKQQNWKKRVWILTVHFYMYLYHAKYVAKIKNYVSLKKNLTAKNTNFKYRTSLLSHFFFKFGCTYIRTYGASHHYCWRFGRQSSTKLFKKISCFLFKYYLHTWWYINLFFLNAFFIFLEISCFAPNFQKEFLGMSCRILTTHLGIAVSICIYCCI